MKILNILFHRVDIEYTTVAYIDRRGATALQRPLIIEF